MTVIYKYAIPHGGMALRLPKEARILTIQAQRNQPQLWVLQDDAIEATEVREIVVYGTGLVIPEDPADLAYLGTFQLDLGDYVFHVFERLS